LEVNRRFRGARNKRESFFLAQFNISTLKMEAIGSSETSVYTQRATRRYIPENGTRHSHRSENLKSYLHIAQNASGNSGFFIL
jgi:hypothetical protein